MSSQNSAPLIYLLPIYLYLLVMLVIPLGIVILGAFGIISFSGVQQPTLKGFQTFFTPGSLYLESTFFTVWNSTVATFLAVAAGYLFAIYLTIRRPGWWDKFSFVPLIAIYTPYLIAAFMWWTLLWPKGYLAIGINWLLQKLGLIREPLYLVNDPYGIGIILGKVWYTFTLTFLLTYGPLQLINPEIVEAARILGAPMRTVITKIYFPLSKYALLASSSIVFLDNLTGVSTPLVLGASWPQYLSVVILNDVTLFFNYLMAFTSGFVYIILSLLAGYFFFRYTTKAIVYQVR
ncbi:ABC transporter permease [Infirmifilum uzonense]|nr:ABC transporter permease subunit [Infirmifilum uzonense]